MQLIVHTEHQIPLEFNIKVFNDSTGLEDKNVQWYFSTECKNKIQSAAQKFKK